MFKKKVKNIEDVAENLRGLYSEVKDKEGKVTGWQLKAEVSDLLSGKDLQEENDKLKKQSEEQAAKIKELSSQKPPASKPPGDKPTQEKPPGTGEQSQQMKDLTAKVDSVVKENQTLKEENSKILQSSVDQRKEALVVQAIQKKGGSVKLLKDNVMSAVGIDTEKSGTDSLFIKDEKGAAKFDGANRVRIDTYLDDLKQDTDYSRAFTEEKKGLGVGSFPAGNAGKNEIGKEDTLSFKNMTPSQEAQYISSYGREAYLEATKKVSQEKTEEISKKYEKGSHGRSSTMPF